MDLDPRQIEQGRRELLELGSMPAEVREAVSAMGIPPEAIQIIEILWERGLGGAGEVIDELGAIAGAEGADAGCSLIFPPPVPTLACRPIGRTAGRAVARAAREIFADLFGASKRTRAAIAAGREALDIARALVTRGRDMRATLAQELKQLALVTDDGATRIYREYTGQSPPWTESRPLQGAASEILVGRWWTTQEQRREEYDRLDFMFELAAAGIRGTERAETVRDGIEVRREQVLAVQDTAAQRVQAILLASQLGIQAAIEMHAVAEAERFGQALAEAEDVCWGHGCPPDDPTRTVPLSGPDARAAARAARTALSAGQLAAKQIIARRTAVATKQQAMQLADDAARAHRDRSYVPRPPPCWGIALGTLALTGAAAAGMRWLT